MILIPFGHAKTSWDMVGSFWLNLDLGGCSRTRVMTIFVFFVGPNFPNIGYFDVYGGILMHINVFWGHTGCVEFRGQRPPDALHTGELRPPSLELSSLWTYLCRTCLILELYLSKLNHFGYTIVELDSHFALKFVELDPFWIYIC